MPSTPSRFSATGSGSFAAARRSPTRSSPGRRSETGTCRSDARSSPECGVRVMPNASLARDARVVVARDSSDARRFLEEATARSLRGDVKELPARWLYDALGSRLYDAVTQLPE